MKIYKLIEVSNNNITELEYSLNETKLELLCQDSNNVFAEEARTKAIAEIEKLNSQANEIYDRQVYNYNCSYEVYKNLVINNSGTSSLAKTYFNLLQIEVELPVIISLTDYEIDKLIVNDRKCYVLSINVTDD